MIAVGGEWDARPNLAKAMEYTFSGCHDFSDGTALVGELTAGPGHIYSPRLTEGELEAWCAEHIDAFHAHYEQNKVALENGELVQVQPWW